MCEMNRIKQMRKAKGLTQLQMQMKTGIDQSCYSKMERGIRYPTIEQITIIARVLGTSIDYLVGLTDVTEPYPATALADKISKQKKEDN